MGDGRHYCHKILIAIGLEIVKKAGPSILASSGRWSKFTQPGFKLSDEYCQVLFRMFHMVFTKASLRLHELNLCGMDA